MSGVHDWMPEQWSRYADEEVAHAQGRKQVWQLFDVDRTGHEYIAAVHETHVVEGSAEDSDPRSGRNPMNLRAIALISHCSCAQDRIWQETR